MGRQRSPLSHDLLVSAVTALTVWLALLAWRGLTETAAPYLQTLFVAGALTALSGAGLRWLRAPLVVVALVQIALVGALVLDAVTGSPLPTGEVLSALATALGDAVDSANRYQAPVPDDAPAVTPLFLVAGGAALVLADLVAVSLGQVAASGLLLLALYSVPVSVAPDSVGASSFALLAAGFLALLFLAQEIAVARWGREVPAEAGAASAGFTVRSRSSRVSALGIGAGTTALAVVVPVVVPTLGLEVWDGPGAGGDGDGITIENPLVDLRRDLQRGADLPLLRVESDGGRPTYVRISVLNRFTGEEWSSGDREVPADQLAQGPMPPLLGVNSALERTETVYGFSATDGFRSQWLPTTPLVSEVNASGDWRYDRSTMDFVSGREELTTAGQTWRVRGVEVAYDALTLDGATAGGAQVGESMVEVPADLPPMVEELAESVAGDQPTRFRQARALQDWFRSDFTYSLDRVDSVGSSELVEFLDEDGREGYCEQFAAAMAVMARTLDIPARVAVGFLEPSEVGPGQWEFSSDDLHAWPELFFPGSGWVRFEPTPPTRASGVPGYTRLDLPEIQEATPRDTPRGSEQLPERPSRQELEEESAATDQDEVGSTFPWKRVLGTATAVVLLVGLLLGPRLLRRRRRERRLQDAGIEAVWAELRDQAHDLGRPWPSGRSPRTIGDVVSRWFGDPAAPGAGRAGSGRTPDAGATEALERLVRALELSRYGRPGSVPQRDPAWVVDLERCTAALEAGSGPRARRRATWVPASVLRREPGSDAPVVRSLPGTLDHVG